MSAPGIEPLVARLLAPLARSLAGARRQLDLESADADETIDDDHDASAVWPADGEGTPPRARAASPATAQPPASSPPTTRDHPALADPHADTPAAVHARPGSDPPPPTAPPRSPGASAAPDPQVTAAPGRADGPQAPPPSPVQATPPGASHPRPAPALHAHTAPETAQRLSLRIEPSEPPVSATRSPPASRPFQLSPASEAPLPVAPPIDAARRPPQAPDASRTGTRAPQTRAAVLAPPAPSPPRAGLRLRLRPPVPLTVAEFDAAPSPAPAPPTPGPAAASSAPPHVNAAPASIPESRPAFLPRSPLLPRVVAALDPVFEQAWRVTDAALPDAPPPAAPGAPDEAPGTAPGDIGTPRVANHFHVNVALSGDATGTGRAPQELEDALVTLLRDAARRQGLDV